MNKIISIVIPIVILIMIVFNIFPLEAHSNSYVDKLNKGESLTVVFLGDSTTEVNDTTKGGYNSVELFRKWADEEYPNQITVINSGSSGNSITQMLDRLDKDVLDFNPDIVVVCTGINDATGKSKISIDEFKSNYTIVINKIKMINADIIIRTPNPLVDPAKKLLMKPYIEATIELSKINKIDLIDIYNVMLTDIENGVFIQMDYMNDGVHPNAKGHKYIYEKLLQFFK